MDYRARRESWLEGMRVCQVVFPIPAAKVPWEFLAAGDQVSHPTVDHVLTLVELKNQANGQRGLWTARTDSQIAYFISRNGWEDPGCGYQFVASAPSVPAWLTGGGDLVLRNNTIVNFTAQPQPLPFTVERCPFCKSMRLHQDYVAVGVGEIPVTPPECLDCGSGQNNDRVWVKHPDLEHAERAQHEATVSDKQRDIDRRWQEQERERIEAIKRQWHQPHQPATNGLGGLSCLMRRKS